MLYPYLLRIIDEHVFQKFNVDRETIYIFVNKILFNSIENHNFDGISYSIYFALKYKIRININVDFLIKSEDCISCLLAYLYCDENSDEKGKEQLYEYAIKLNTNEDDFYKNWIFVYEILSSDELKLNEWKKLKTNNVSFFKQTIKANRG